MSVQPTRLDERELGSVPDLKLKLVPVTTQDYSETVKLPDFDYLVDRANTLIAAISTTTCATPLNPIITDAQVLGILQGLEAERDMYKNMLQADSPEANKFYGQVDELLEIHKKPGLERKFAEFRDNPNPPIYTKS